MAERPTHLRPDNSLDLLARSRNLLETIPKALEGDLKALFQRQIGMPDEFQINLRANPLTAVVLANRKRFYPMTFRLVYDFSELENIAIRTSKPPDVKATNEASGQTADDLERSRRRNDAAALAKVQAETERSKRFDTEVNQISSSETKFLAGQKSQDAGTAAGQAFDQDNSRPLSPAQEEARKASVSQAETDAFNAEKARLEDPQTALTQKEEDSVTGHAGDVADNKARERFDQRNPPPPTLLRQDQIQIDSIDRTRVGPPVVSDPFMLWVNPESLTFNFEKVISDTFTRRGHINEYWGDRQLQLSARGRTPGFYTRETGLTRVHRAKSGAYSNLMTLVAMYRNNGYQYDLEDKRRIARVGTIVVTYDGVQYEGRFENFRVSEDDTTPFWLEYEFEFWARAARRLPVVAGAEAVITVNL